MTRKIDLTKYLRSRIIPWVFSIILLAALIVTWLILQKPTQEKIVTKFSLDLDKDLMLDVNSYPALAISHDGKSIVFKS